MRDFRFVDGTWDPESLRPENYPPVRVEDIPSDYRARYYQLRRSLELYLRGEMTVAKISVATGVGSSTIYDIARLAVVPEHEQSCRGRTALC